VLFKKPESHTSWIEVSNKFLPEHTHAFLYVSATAAVTNKFGCQTEAICFSIHKEECGIGRVQFTQKKRCG
jgi:hypothetical protein